MYKKLSHFFWFIIKPYRWHVAGVYATAFLNAVSLSASPYLLKIIIDAVSTNTGTKLEIFKTLTWPVLGYLLAHVLTACNYRFNDWLILKLFPNCKQGIITHMYAYLNKHSYQYFQNSFAGSLLNKILDMVGSFPPVLRKLDLFFGLFCLVLIANFILFQVHPIFAMILFTWTLAFLGLSASFTKKIKALSHDFSSLKTKTSGYIVDSISNMLNVRLFASERFESERIGAALLDTVQADRSLQRAILKMRILQDLGIIGLMAAMLYGLLYFYGLGKITAGDFALVLSISATVFQWVWYLASEFVFFAEDLGKCAQALSIISAPHAIRDREPPKLLEIKSGKIEFKDLKFGYESKGPLFEKFNVILKAGEKTGLVGFSGSGKTTFVNLILRFFDVQAGAILIDDQNIGEITQESLHKAIAMIPQDTSLFHRTLMENIRYGNQNASDSMVLEASKQAHCHEFIMQIPGQYEALVGERGIKLSGGQRQRIAIARAILKKAPILILDEATSALDSVTEKYIHDSLKTLMEGRTTLVIAHRLSTLAEMDRILVFDKGQIIEDGNHEELLKLDGHYAKMWQMQAGGFLPERQD